MVQRSTYDEDFFLWTQEQGSLLRAVARERTDIPLDFENLAEEIESAGRRDRREVRERLRCIITGLLRLQYVPGADDDREFRPAIMRERFDLELVIEDSPSLRLTMDLAALYADALRIVCEEVKAQRTGPLPNECPFTLDQIMAPDWWPENKFGRV